MSDEPDPRTLPGPSQVWARLLDRIAVHFPLVERCEAWLKLQWPDNQTVQVMCVTIHAQTRLFLTADICPADVFTDRTVLELGAKLLFGGPIISNGMLSIRHVFTNGQFTTEQLEQGIGLLHGNALRFRQRLVECKANAAHNVFEPFDY